MLKPLRAALFAVPNLLIAAVLLAVAACSMAQQQAVTTSVQNFEAKAGPAIAQGCATFHAAEANPLVQVAVAAGSMAANAATGGVAGPAIAITKSFGDNFCAMGPPAGDTTTPAQQAAWVAGVGQQLLTAAGVKTGG